MQLQTHTRHPCTCRRSKAGATLCSGKHAKNVRPQLTGKNRFHPPNMAMCGDLQRAAHHSGQNCISASTEQLSEQLPVKPAVVGHHCSDELESSHASTPAVAILASGAQQQAVDDRPELTEHSIGGTCPGTLVDLHGLREVAVIEHITIQISSCIPEDPFGISSSQEPSSRCPSLLSPRCTLLLCICPVESTIQPFRVLI